MTKKIEIFTTMFCPYCHAAKRLLDKKGVAYDEIDVMMSPAKRRDMADRAGSNTVPQIFIDGQHIGDCDDIHEMDFDGVLDEKLGIG